MFPIETPTCDFRLKILSMENNNFFIQSKSLKHIKLIYSSLTKANTYIFVDL